MTECRALSGKIRQYKSSPLFGPSLGQIPIPSVLGPPCPHVFTLLIGSYFFLFPLPAEG